MKASRYSHSLPPYIICSFPQVLTTFHQHSLLWIPLQALVDFAVLFLGRALTFCLWRQFILKYSVNVLVDLFASRAVSMVDGATATKHLVTSLVSTGEDVMQWRLSVLLAFYVLLCVCPWAKLGNLMGLVWVEDGRGDVFGFGPQHWRYPESY